MADEIERLDQFPGESRIDYRRRVALEALLATIEHNQNLGWPNRDGTVGLAPVRKNPQQLGAEAAEIADELTKRLFALEDKDREDRGDPAPEKARDHGPTTQNPPE